MTIRFRPTISAGLLLLGGLAHAEERKIATVYWEAAGCTATSNSYSITIPEMERLNTSHTGGPLPGIEFRETNKVNRAGYRDVVLSGNTLSFRLFAEGKGTVQGGGDILGVKVPQVCVGAEGASAGYDIYVHLRPAQVSRAKAR